MKTNLKPFDLKAALSGVPVMLRNGLKAYVRHHETELHTSTDNILLGYDDDLEECSWSIEGACVAREFESPYDIVGMYPRTRIINGFEVPAPETVELDYDTFYYLASTLKEHFYSDDVWESHHTEKRWLERGLVFLTKEAAIANAKAMLGIDPKEEVAHEK